MKVSEFQIGRGELYYSRSSSRFANFCEVIAVQPSRGHAMGRQVIVADHDERTGRQVDGTTRLYFGLSQFLREWRPARISDFPERATKSRRRR